MSHLKFLLLTPLNLPKGETFGQQFAPYSPPSPLLWRGWGRSGLGEVWDTITERSQGNGVGEFIFSANLLWDNLH